MVYCTYSTRISRRVVTISRQTIGEFYLITCHLNTPTYLVPEYFEKERRSSFESHSSVPREIAIGSLIFRYNLVGDGNTHIYIDRDVLKSELREGVNTDYVLKLVVHNREQEKRPLYMMFSGVGEKRLWYTALQDTIERYSRGVSSAIGFSWGIRCNARVKKPTERRLLEAW